jgi:superfamily II DNA or RNA helicase
MDLRKNQEECIESIQENFLENKKGLIKMFCGSGKSLIIYHSLLKYCEKLSVLVVPSINLITQFNNDYMLNALVNDFNKKYFNKKFDLMSICSKDELENPDGNSNLITTDKYEINKFINKNNQKILLVTYQSLPNLIEIIKDNNILIDIICFDEAHHILGENISKLLLAKSNNFIDNFVDKTLFFTATPKNTKDYKMYDNLTEITIDNIQYDIIDNINEDNYNKSICGPLVYEYSHLAGVTDDILNDFNIRVELYSKNTKSTIFKRKLIV